MPDTSLVLRAGLAGMLAMAEGGRADGEVGRIRAASLRLELIESAGPSVNSHTATSACGCTSGGPTLARGLGTVEVLALGGELPGSQVWADLHSRAATRTLPTRRCSRFVRGRFSRHGAASQKLSGQ